jgi:hypothetical protein
MKKRISIAILAAMILALVFGAVGVMAAGEPTTFFLSVYHFVKGDEIDLTQEAPVIIHVVKDGVTIGLVPMQYRQRFETNLPGGSYEFLFKDAETGSTLFTCGPYDFENGDHVQVQAHEQGPGRTPDCYEHVR